MNAASSEVCCYYCETFGENPGRRGYAEGQNLELIMLSTYHEPEAAPLCWVDANMEVHIFEVEGSHEVALLKQCNNILKSNHLEVL